MLVAERRCQSSFGINDLCVITSHVIRSSNWVRCDINRPVHPTKREGHARLGRQVPLTRAIVDSLVALTLRLLVEGRDFIGKLDKFSHGSVYFLSKHAFP